MIKKRSEIKKKVTLSIDSEVYDEFSKYCKKEGIILSKQVEFFMKKELEKIKEEGGDSN
jgi:hypothetical protein